MRLLLDTHILLWAASAPHRLPGTFRERIESPDNEVLFSAASIWELAIKSGLGRIALPMPVEAFFQSLEDHGFRELPMTAMHAAGVEHLPDHHRDPFDRLLVAQAIAEPARLLTADRALASYSELVELG